MTTVFDAQRFLTVFSRKYGRIASDSSIFKHISVLNSKDPATMVSRIQGIDGAREFFNLKPHHISNMVPYLRIFKVQEREGEEIYNELIFKDRYDEKFFFSMLEDSSDRQAGIGLDSFNYILDGKNPAEVLMVRATLKLLITNLEDLAYIQENGASFLDLLLPPAPSSRQMVNTEGVIAKETYKTEDFQIKVEMGWNLSPGIELDPVVQEFIKSQRVILALCAGKHEYDFQENGNITLTIEYYGSIETNMSSPYSDIFFSREAIRLKNEIDSINRSISSIKSSENYTRSNFTAKGIEKDIEERDKVLKETAATREDKEFALERNIVSSLARPEFELQVDQLLAEEEKLKKEIATLQSQLQDFENATSVGQVKDLETKVAALQQEVDRDRTRKYSSFLEGLIRNGKIFSVELNEELINRFERLYTKSAEPDSQANDFRAYTNEYVLRNNLFVPPNMTRYTGVQTQNLLSANESYIKQIEEANPSNKEKEESKKEGSGSELVDIFEKGFTNIKEFVSDALRKEIPFVFLGDLIEIASSNLRNANSPILKNTNIILGPTTIFVPKPYRLNQVNQFEKVNINCAFLPVSIEFFQEWFLENVVKKQREVYPLRSFIRDIINSLLNNLFDVSTSSYDKMVSGDMALVISTFSLPSLNEKNEPPIPISYDYQEKERYNLDGRALDLIKFSKLKELNDVTNEKIWNYLLIIPNIIVLNNLKGDPEEDEPKGIYHIHLGRNGGPVKKIKLSQIDVPSIREARMVEVNSSQLELFRMVYNVKLTMLGNHLFGVHQYFYLDPTFPGQGNPEKKKEIASKLGLGGYYSALKVETSLNRDSRFETTLEGHFINYGDGTTHSSVGEEVVQKEFGGLGQEGSALKDKTNAD